MLRGIQTFGRGMGSWGRRGLGVIIEGFLGEGGGGIMNLVRGRKVQQKRKGRRRDMVVHQEVKEGEDILIKTLEMWIFVPAFLSSWREG